MPRRREALANVASIPRPTRGGAKARTVTATRAAAQNRTPTMPSAHGSALPGRALVAVATWAIQADGAQATQTSA